MAGIQFGALSRAPPASEPARDAEQHSTDSIFVNRNVRAVSFERIADIGGEAPVPQRPVKRPDADACVAVDAPRSEERVRPDVPEDVGACIDGYRKASLERPRNRKREPDGAARMSVLLSLDELEQWFRFDRSPAIEGMHDSRPRDEAPPVPFRAGVVPSVPCAQVRLQTGGVGDPPADPAPWTDVALIRFAFKPSSSETYAARDASRDEQAREPGIAGCGDVVPLRASIELRGGRCARAPHEAFR